MKKDKYYLTKGNLSKGEVTNKLVDRITSILSGIYSNGRKCFQREDLYDTSLRADILREYIRQTKGYRNALVLGINNETKEINIFDITGSKTIVNTGVSYASREYLYIDTNFVNEILDMFMKYELVIGKKTSKKQLYKEVKDKLTVFINNYNNNKDK